MVLKEGTMNMILIPVCEQRISTVDFLVTAIKKTKSVRIKIHLRRVSVIDSKFHRFSAKMNNYSIIKKMSFFVTAIVV